MKSSDSRLSIHVLASLKQASCIALILLSTAATAFSIPQNDYDQLIVSIVALLKDGKNAEALPKALDALRLGPTRYEGHLYLGIIRYRQDSLEDAEALIKKALDLAPDDRKPKIRDTLQVVLNARSFNELTYAADQALKQGLYGRAAQSYTKAWEATPEREDIGLKAAQIWNDRLNNPAESARILWTIANNPQNQETGRQASQMLRMLQPKLESFFDERFRSGKARMEQGLTSEAIEDFSFATNLIPTRQEPYIYLARLFASEWNVEDAIQALAQGFRAGPISLDRLSDYEEFGNILSSRQFITFLNDALGVDVSGSLPKLRAGYVSKTVNTISGVFKGIDNDVTGGDTYFYRLNQRMSVEKESDPCKVFLTIEDEFRRRNSKSVQMLITNKYSLSLAAIDPARLQVREETGPTEAISLIASNPKDQPKLPERWVVELRSKDGLNSFILDKHTYKSWEPGMFTLRDTSETRDKRFMLNGIVAYAGRDKPGAQRAASAFLRGIQLCSATGNSN